MRTQCIDVRRTPTSVDDAESRLLDPKRQFEKPVHPIPMFLGVLSNLFEKSPVLLAIFLSLAAMPGTEVVAVIHGVRRSPCYSIKLVVSHHYARRSGVGHR